MSKRKLNQVELESGIGEEIDVDAIEVEEDVDTELIEGIEADEEN